ncbi:hypothetical protein PsYK624_040110 [Phanerochaete sordida]|uniref:Uncharacterized protein n=1 Tax=Phanerochaete sordida TaxID=48140 RepID=A0A9P3LBD4_9APHY|nr:hypothetical protein PsYK624_040110 [Phanerochaete sordida]
MVDEDRRFAYAAEIENIYGVTMLPQAAVSGAWQIVDMLRTPVIQQYILQNIPKADASIQADSDDAPTKEAYTALYVELQELKTREICWQVEKAKLQLEVCTLKREIESMGARSESVRTMSSERTRADSPMHKGSLGPLLPHSSIPLTDDVDKELLRLNDEPFNMNFHPEFPSFDDPSTSTLSDLIPQDSPGAIPITFTNAEGGVLHVEDLAVPQRDVESFAIPQRAESHIDWTDKTSSTPDPHSSSPPLPSSSPEPEDNDDMLGPSAAAEMDVDVDFEDALLSSGRSSPRDEFGIPLPRNIFEFEIRVVRAVAASSVPALTREEQKTCFRDMRAVSESGDSDDDMSM